MNFPDITITLSTPDKIEEEQLKIFYNLIISGNQIPGKYIDQGIRTSDLLAFCEVDDNVVGFASIKNSRKSYREKVFTQAKADNIAQDFFLEIGYVVVDEKYRGMGISSQLIQFLIEGSASKTFFATTKVDAMRKILSKLGFQKTGSDYTNDKAETLSLFTYNLTTSKVTKESDELFLLRFRYGRAAEMLIAYKTFLHRQVIVGEESYCANIEVVRQITHTLLLTFYSFIYSLFDKGGTDFIRATEPYSGMLSEDGKRIRNELIDIWNKNEKAISKLRHNIGFHGGVKLKSQEVGYFALSEIHPQTPLLIMNNIAIVFGELDKILPPRENYAYHVSPHLKSFFFNRAEKLKGKINNPEFFKWIDGVKKLYSFDPSVNEVNE